MARVAALPDRDASFTEQKHVSSLAAPVVSSGRLVFRHPAHLEQITLLPKPETLVIDHGVLGVSEDGGAMRRVPLEAHPALQGLVTTLGYTLAGNLEALQRIYGVTATGSDAAWRITMVPRAAPLSHFITSIIVDGAGSDMRGLDILQANGDRQTMAIRPSQ